MKTICYIDGLNLFYRSLKGTAFKWLDIQSLIKASLSQDADIITINYYTARVSGKTDSKDPERQNAYLRAIDTLDKVQIHYGNFLTTKKWAKLAKPLQFRPDAQFENNAEPDVAFVIKTEEKGSDVNLGVHLVRDAAMKKMEAAAIITNDTDLMEAMRIAGKEFGVKIILLSPVDSPSRQLRDNSDEVFEIKKEISKHQLPEEITLANGRVVKKPAGW